MQIGAAPLRCDKRLANTLLWDMFAANQSATGWVLSHAIGKGWKKERNKREAETLARALDLAIIEMGTDYVEKSAAWEVLIRRLRAVVLADKMGKWDLPMLLEELPSAFWFLLGSCLPYRPAAPSRPAGRAAPPR